MDLKLSDRQEKALRVLAKEVGKPVELLAAELLDEAISQQKNAVNVRPAPCNAVPPERRLAHLRGLGKEIWKGEDAQAYVNRLREEE